MSAIENGGIHKYYRPFGYSTPEAQAKSQNLLSSAFTQLQRAIPGAVIGSCFGGVYPGAILGAVVGVAAIGCAKVIQALWTKKKVQIEDISKKDPLLGKYRKADVQLLPASASYSAKKALIASAKNSIEIIGSYAGGVHFQEVLDIIESKLEENTGLRVHILFCPDMSTQEDFDRVASLKKRYPGFFEYCISPAKLSFSAPHTRENHSKLIVVDEKYFVLGGTSIFSRLNKEQASLKEEETHLTCAAGMLEKSVQDMDAVGRGVTLLER